jgi:hypothetical protein
MFLHELRIPLRRLLKSNDARRLFEAAWRRVLLSAQAQGHLAEVEAELGEVDWAISRLRSLAASSDDPDYAAQLARILGNVGHEDESRRWRRLAAARYDELIARIRKPSPTMLPNSGLLRVATGTKRCGWRK